MSSKMKSGSGFSKCDSKEINRSVYYYKDVDVLINKENIKDANALAQYEADMTMFRQYQLEKEQMVKGRFGITHLNIKRPEIEQIKQGTEAALAWYFDTKVLLCYTYYGINNYL